MKKKISVVALLFSLLLALAVPVQAKAEDFNAECPLTFDKDSGCIFADTGTSVTLSEESLNLIREGYNVLVYACDYSGTWYIYLYYFKGSYSFTYWTPSDSNLDCYCFISNGSELLTTDNFSSAWSESKIYYTSNDKFGTNSSLKSTSLSNNNISNFAENYLYVFINKDADEISHVYSDGELRECEVTQENALYSVELKYNPYTFEEWISAAGLSCSASSNESSSVIPFWYEPDNYNYIVRKNLSASSTSGVYQLTMLQKTDGAHYPYYFEVNNLGYLGVAGSFTDTSTFTIRNFYYDADGNGWKYIERFDVSSLPFDNTNVNFSDNEVLVYSDADIFSDRQASAVWQSASTEYYNVDIPEPEVPTPTPTNVPSSDSGRPGSGTRPDTGGQATGGGGLDFIINLFTLIWQKICSIPMAVDGYSISLQQLFVYGALVSIIGGFIIHFIFGRK